MILEREGRGQIYIFGALDSVGEKLRKIRKLVMKFSRFEFICVAEKQQVLRI